MNIAPDFLQIITFDGCALCIAVPGHTFSHSQRRAVRLLFDGRVELFQCCDEILSF